MSTDVVEARPVGSTRLWLRFDDGATGTVDVTDIQRMTGLFAPLLDPVFFAQVAVDPELGTIHWPNGADICPDVLYAEATGRAIEHDGKVVYTPHQTRETTP